MAGQSDLSKFHSMQSMGALIKILAVNQLQHLPREARSTIAKENIAAAVTAIKTRIL